MSDQRIDTAGEAATSASADPGEGGQGVASPSMHAGGTVPGGGSQTGDALMDKGNQAGTGDPDSAANSGIDHVEDAVTADTEGGQALQRQAAMTPDATPQG